MATRKKVKGKLSGLKADGKPNAYWRRFKERLDTYDQHPVSDWNEEHYLGHILKRYKDIMEIDFSMSYSGPPTKCKEIYCIRRMVNSMGTEDPVIIKEYIDWVFDAVIVPQKVTFQSIAYFFTTTFILKFKAERRKKSRITRATKLPESLVNIATNLDLDVTTYGDLALAQVAIDDDPGNEAWAPYVTLFDKMKESGFDINTLSKIEG